MLHDFTLGNQININSNEQKLRSWSNDMLQCTCEAYMKNTYCIGKTKYMSACHQPFFVSLSVSPRVHKNFCLGKKYKKR
jgi:hypothetical protein